MVGRLKQIVAFGGGGFSMEAGNPLLDDYVLSLTGKERPKVCFIPTASGDADHYVVRFYRAFGPDRCHPSHVSLFRRDKGGGIDECVGEHLLQQDRIYVGGGSVISLLGVWRAHGLDDILRQCWERGIVLCGLSAGSLCWFEQSVTAFHGAPSQVEGLGLLPYSNGVHYDAEPQRRPLMRELVGDGTLPPGYATDDGVGLLYRGTDMVQALSERDGAGAFRLDRVDGTAQETRLDVRRLA